MSPAARGHPRGPGASDSEWTRWHRDQRRAGGVTALKLIVPGSARAARSCFRVRSLKQLHRDPNLKKPPQVRSAALAAASHMARWQPPARGSLPMAAAGHSTEGTSRATSASDNLTDSELPPAPESESEPRASGHCQVQQRALFQVPSPSCAPTTDTMARSSPQWVQVSASIRRSTSALPHESMIILCPWLACSGPWQPVCSAATT